MHQNVYAVYDQAAKAYLAPFFLNNDEMAIRIFRDCANSNDHQFGRFPSDYTLFHLGTFDDTTGMLESWAPQKIISALEVLVDDNQPTQEDLIAPLENGQSEPTTGDTPNG